MSGKPTKFFQLSDPLEYIHITQHFGENGKYYNETLGIVAHSGTDFRAGIGTPTVACIDGTITSAGTDHQGGKFIKLKTGKVDELELELMYYHLDAVEVVAGERVYRGQRIGLTGNTGRYTSGPHLHLAGYLYYEGKLDFNNGYRGAVDIEHLFTYKPMAENPYGIPNDTLIQLVEGIGGFALWTGEHFIKDDLDKVLASWMVRNKGKIEGKTMAVAQVVWDAYPNKVNFKLQPLT